MKIQSFNVNPPQWKTINVASSLPEELKGLGEIARNFWYVWNYEATDVFSTIDPDLWEDYKNNAVLLLERTNYKRFEELLNNESFMKKYHKAYDKFNAYMAEKPAENSPSIAYFSMEYGLADILKIYSGGLGILAGDYLKEASDCNVNMTAVGLMYHYGYFTQTLSINGEQQAIFEAQNLNLLPVEQVKDENNNLVKFTLPFPGRDLHVAIWKVNVGRVSLLLLDTDLEENNPADRTVTHQLYGGDWENRLKQELLLGFGGIKALETLGIEKELYHCNEGHAAFINASRLSHYVNFENLDFEVALELVRASSLFTTHTPVPAGHDSFDEDMLKHYLSYMPEQLTLGWDDFMALGRTNPDDKNSKFSMSVFAAKTSQEMNGVSWLHGKVSQDMFQNLWPGFMPEELHIDYVTNGVHYGTWTAREWRRLYEKNFGEDFLTDISNPAHWKKIYSLQNDEIWKVKLTLKEKLVDYIKQRFEEDWLKKQGDPSRIVQLIDGMQSNVLTIGFARRFATYKRAHLLFNDLDRLSKILNNPEKPVQFLFAGKAHPADGGGQGLIKHIVEISRRPEFLGKIIFLENYDMSLARRLVSGVDIWLNTPTRPLEASGTSGQKAEMNGTLNLSVLDGWWLEGYREEAGWAITDKRTYDNQAFQDELDAATIYSLLENDIVPAYYNRNKEGLSPDWIEYIKKSVSEIAPHYTTKRMLDDYIHKFYTKQHKRVTKLKADDKKLARELADWKNKVIEQWDDIEIKSVDIPDFAVMIPKIGESFDIKVVADIKGLKAEDLGIELVQMAEDDEMHKQYVKELNQLEVSEVNGSEITYHLNLKFSDPGSYNYAIRMYARHENLPHRQDFGLVKWLN
ncbi:alpha-glucan family phosphorylase [Saccharicrinis sp. FJH54]|uniref:alpha-glucan family phosphorylase n=1 Tax=Saccharicrinis sp. FJH54 TaxID=3344665 RepID=UPI0035D4B294